MVAVFVSVTVLLFGTIFGYSITTHPAAITTDTNSNHNPTTHVQQAAADSTQPAAITNEPQQLTIDGINLSFAVNPTTVHASDLTHVEMKVADAASGAPLSHTDWAIVITTPDGKEVYKTSTTHAHMGTMSFNYAFLEPGKNTIHVQVASLGPKMLGMDVPKEAQTRIFKSGDMMKSPSVDPTDFFGTRAHDFVVNVGSQGGIRTLVSETGTSVKVELATNPLNIVAGQPTTLIFNIKDAKTDKNIMHPDALISIKQGPFAESSSAPAGSPMMPMMGAYHGHTGEIAVTTVFPSTGLYRINAEINSLPVSDVQFGHVHTLFRVFVSDGAASGTSQSVPTTTQLPPNHVAILGQVAPYYNPNNITVKAGDTLTFKNHDSIIHTATSTNAGANDKNPEPDSVFDTGLLNPGEEKQIKFDKVGIYNYFCMVHPFMRGTVTVTG
jgi:plastocyanin